MHVCQQKNTVQNGDTSYKVHTLAVVWVGLVNSLLTDSALIEGWIWVKSSHSKQKQKKETLILSVILPNKVIMYLHWVKFTITKKLREWYLPGEGENSHIWAI